MSGLLRRLLLLIAVVAASAYALLPLYYAAVSSLQPASAALDTALLPLHPDLHNYAAVLGDGLFMRSVLNSTLLACGVVLLSLLIALPAAYALARARFRGRRSLLLAVLGVSMFPPVAVLPGMFALVRDLGLYDSLGALLLSDLLLTLPFTLWVLVSFMADVPRELEEAAMLDGATAPQILLRIVLPLLWPAIATTALLAFIAAWNEFMFALTFAISPDRRTVPVAISLFGGSSPHEMPWGSIMAASIVVTVPLIALVFAFHRRIVGGLTRGAVKG